LSSSPASSNRDALAGSVLAGVGSFFGSALGATGAKSLSSVSLSNKDFLAGTGLTGVGSLFGSILGRDG
jgi:hypothetical protein